MSGMVHGLIARPRGRWVLFASLTTLFLLLVLTQSGLIGPAQADATSTSFSPSRVGLGSVGSSAVITVETVGVDSTADGVQVNIQHPATLEVSDPACVGIFDGASLTPVEATDGGTLIGCFFIGPDVGGTTGEVMTFTLTQMSDCVEGTIVSFGIGGDSGTQYSDGGIGIGPGSTNQLEVVCGVTIGGTTTLQFRTNTEGQVKVTLTPSDVGTGDDGFPKTATAASDGSWQVPGVPPGTYDLEAGAFSYLSGRMEGLEVGDTDVSLPPNELKAGDINGSGSVNINDITGTVSNFGKGPQTWPVP